MNPTSLQIYITLLVCGVLLLGAEIYVPGGILGALGAIALVAAAVLGFQFGTVGGLISVAGILLLAALVVYLWIRIFPKTGVGRRLTLSQDGRAFKLDDAEARAALGREGVALSPLRPAGVGEIEGRRRDVITRGIYLEAGRRFRVVGVEGARCIVEPVEEATAERGAS